MDQDTLGLFSGMFLIIFSIIALVFTVIMIASIWKVFEKASQPGWAAIIPIYNFIVLLKIVGKPLWWLILAFIPLVNMIALVLVYLSLAKSFGKSAGFGIGLLLLGFVFFPILGFGDARYLGAPAGDAAIA